MQVLTISDVEQAAFYLAKELMSFDEPIPDYHTRFPNILESCVATPFQGYAGRVFYRGLISKSSILFYLMVKNHPFLNGNKRIAITTLLLFLFMNKKWLYASLEEFYNFSMMVAESKAEDKESVVLEIRRFIKKHLRRLPSSN
jgi:death on curing protein